MPPDNKVSSTKCPHRVKALYPNLMPTDSGNLFERLLLEFHMKDDFLLESVLFKHSKLSTSFLRFSVVYLSMFLLVFSYSFRGNSVDLMDIMSTFVCKYFTNIFEKNAAVLIGKKELLCEILAKL